MKTLNEVEYWHLMNATNGQCRRVPVSQWDRDVAGLLVDRGLIYGLECVNEDCPNDTHSYLTADGKLAIICYQALHNVESFYTG